MVRAPSLSAMKLAWDKQLVEGTPMIIVSVFFRKGVQQGSLRLFWLGLKDKIAKIQDEKPTVWKRQRQQQAGGYGPHGK